MGDEGRGVEGVMKGEEWMGRSGLDGDDGRGVDGG